MSDLFKNRYLAPAGLLLVLISLVLMSVYTPMFLDYFFFKGGIEQDGLFKFQLVQYFWWDGRFFTFTALIQSLLIAWAPHWIIILFYAACLAVVPALFLQYTKLFNIDIKPVSYASAYFFLLILFFYGFYSHLAQSLFWAVGGVYMLGLVVFILFLLVAETLSEAKLFSWKGLTFIGVTTIAGGLGQNVFPGTLLFLVFVLLSKWKSINKFTFFIGALGHLASMAIVVLSPGNARRSHFWKSEYEVSLLRLIENFIGVLKGYFSISLLLAIGMIVFVLIFYRVDSKSFKAKDHIVRAVLFLAMMLAVSIPFALLPEAATPRTSLVFMICFSLGLFHVSALLKFRLSGMIAEITPCWANILMIIAMMGHGYYTWLHIEAGRNAIDIQQRNENAILKQKSEGVKNIQLHYEKIPISVFSVNYTDATVSSSDSGYWVNEQLALYYGVESVIDIKEE